MALLLVRLAGFSLAEALDQTWEEARAWLEEALTIEKELHG